MQEKPILVKLVFLKEMNKNFLEHNIKKLLSSDWGIECNSPFKHVFR